MMQKFLKSSFEVARLTSPPSKISFNGEGASIQMSDSGLPSHLPKCVIPVDGVFNNLVVYSPVGLHSNYTITLMINGVASALTCSLTSGNSVAFDKTHSVSVVAGDDFYLSIQPSASSAGEKPLNVSLEFNGSQHFYCSGIGGPYNVGEYANAGALGNGRFAMGAALGVLSNSYSICAVSGTIKGLRMKSFFANVGGSWIARIVKNKILQDGTGGTIDTTCTLVDGNVHTTSTFLLPIVAGDHVDIILSRTGTNVGILQNAVSTSVLFNPTDASSFMFCGGNNDATTNSGAEYKWMQSKQIALDENIPKCPIGPTGITLTGLYIEVPSPGIGKSRTFTVRKNGVGTAATVTIADLNSSALITGLAIDFVENDFIDIEVTNIGTPITGLGVFWGISTKATATIPPDGGGDGTDSRSGIYYIGRESPGGTKHDRYRGDVLMKIPNPTVRTALVGD